VRAIVREDQVDVLLAAERFDSYLAAANVDIMPIGAREQALAIEAFDRFGKGRHPAALNMGDCFAYACARTLGLPLLYKGDDFGRTDIPAA
jgi:ribonuclease VapC